MCFLLHLKKIRVGRSLLIFFFFFNFFFFISPYLSRNTTDVLFARSLYGKGVFSGYLLAIKNACPTVKAFHRKNLNQNKCLNSNTASNMTAKVAKPIKMTANRVGCI